MGNWWSLLIIRDGFDGVRRFSEFPTGLGVPQALCGLARVHCFRVVISLITYNWLSGTVGWKILSILKPDRLLSINTKPNQSDA